MSLEENWTLEAIEEEVFRIVKLEKQLEENFTNSYLRTMLVPTINSELYRVRKAGIPETCQQDIYHKLEIDYVNLPKSKMKIQNKATTL